MRVLTRSRRRGWHPARTCRLGPYPTAAWSASPSFTASSADNSTTSLPPPSNGTRITMPRPSLVTSSGPSPVRGFIAAMLHPLPQRTPHPNRVGQVPAHGTPVSNNRVDPSPYYPVFGRRMVMISYARRSLSVPNRLASRASRLVPMTPRRVDAGRRGCARASAGARHCSGRTVHAANTGQLIPLISLSTLVAAGRCLPSADCTGKPFASRGGRGRHCVACAGGGRRPQL